MNFFSWVWRKVGNNIFRIFRFNFQFSLDHRCDQIVHCDDKSDEGGCSLVVLEDSYNKEIPPILIDEQNELVPVQVKVSTSIKSVLDISESSHTIDLKLGIKLEWFENRAKYHNLKRDSSLNVLSNAEVNIEKITWDIEVFTQVGHIWVPYIIFSNTDNDDAISVQSARTVIFISRMGNFTRSGPEIADEVNLR